MRRTGPVPVSSLADAPPHTRVRILVPLGAHGPCRRGASPGRPPGGGPSPRLPGRLRPPRRSHGQPDARPTAPSQPPRGPRPPQQGLSGPLRLHRHLRCPRRLLPLPRPRVSLGAGRRSAPGPFLEHRRSGAPLRSRHPPHTHPLHPHPPSPRPHRLPPSAPRRRRPGRRRPPGPRVLPGPVSPVNRPPTSSRGTTSSPRRRPRPGERR